MQRRRRRPHLKVPEGLDIVLERSGENRFSRNTPPIPQEIWIKIVGLRVADRARPVSLERGVLTLRVSTSVWANELSMLSESITVRLRDAGFEVQTIRFRVAPIASSERPPERRTKIVGVLLHMPLWTEFEGTDRIKTRYVNFSLPPLPDRTGLARTIPSIRRTLS